VTSDFVKAPEIKKAPSEFEEGKATLATPPWADDGHAQLPQQEKANPADSLFVTSLYTNTTLHLPQNFVLSRRSVLQLLDTEHALRDTCQKK
jgi:hypothetical protein